MAHAQFHCNLLSGSGEKKIWVFYHLRAWRPSWSCNPVSPNKMPFPRPMETSHEIWLQLDDWLSEERMFEKLTDGRRTDGGRQSPGFTKRSPMSLKAQVSLKERKKNTIFCYICWGFTAIFHKYRQYRFKTFFLQSRSERK